MKLDTDLTVRRPLAVVIVTYNSAGSLPGLLDTLEAGLKGIAKSEIVVADNASSDQSVALALTHPAGVRVVQTGRNGGYAAGINAAVATIDRDADLLILNPDIRVSAGSIVHLVDQFRHPGVGIAVPRMVHEDGTLVFSLRREPSLLTAWADALLGARFAHRIDLGECICNDQRYAETGTVDWASGAALAVSGVARSRIGDWDESFFLYSEEVDYQRRARSAGFRIVFDPDACFVHIGGDYSRNARLYGILTTNRIRDYARHHGSLGTTVFRAAVLTGEVLRSLRGSAVHRSGVLAAWNWRREGRPGKASRRAATQAHSSSKP